MAKTETKTEAGTGTKLSRFQKFDTETIHRGLLKGAPYNPRKIGNAARQKLTASLKDHGLIAPLVWNKRTGHLVSGHQRLSILDALEGADDYELTVAVIDVDEREEKVLNVQVNNESMMGEWDLDLLGALNLEDGISFGEMGFIDSDAELMFGGDERFTPLFENDDTAREKGTLKDIKQARGEMVKELEAEQSADFYFVVVCKDQKDKDALLGEMGYPNYEEYVHSDAVRRLRKGG